MEQENNETYAVRPRHHRRRIEYSDRNNHFALRNTLNIIFMVLAIIGVILWTTMDDHTIAIIILLVGVAIKIGEVCIRMFK